ncbi:MAG: RsbRD N-terminal domain-containing protein [Deltaproteobacteria bacterium]|jgi:hypothetical protein|nr:RsbRD N-terminal domain-containing protein [Deltaproteobacteria bacterium]
MAFSFARILTKQRSKIIEKWVEKLHTQAGEQYAARPIEELRQTVTEAVDANYQIIVNKNYDDVDAFIDKITDMRLKAGFLLSDVQKAFELYRIVLIDILLSHAAKKELNTIIEQLNICLAYTMNRFSDHFQEMHQKKFLNRTESWSKL